MSHPQSAFARKIGRETITLLQYPPVSQPGFRQHKKEALTAAQLKRIRGIIGSTPTGPRPIDVAESFVDRFYDKAPWIISQAPVSATSNPLIEEFFKATALQASDDLTPWCAAFVNYCISRTGKKGTDSAWSQSFLPPAFTRVDAPAEGDLAVFTCYGPNSGASVGLGHVAFFKRYTNGNAIEVIGGNQSGDGHRSIISRKIMSLGNQAVRRHLADGQYAAVTMRLNAFVRLS